MTYILPRCCCGRVPHLEEIDAVVSFRRTSRAVRVLCDCGVSTSFYFFSQYYDRRGAYRAAAESWATYVGGEHARRQLYFDDKVGFFYEN